LTPDLAKTSQESRQFRQILAFWNGFKQTNSTGPASGASGLDAVAMTAAQGALALCWEGGFELVVPF
jgi:hypothetical protein